MAERILLVEDKGKLVRVVELELQYKGYEVKKAFGGCAGLDRALSGEFDLMLLDIILLALSGMEVLRCLRREGAVPVIMLAAQDTVVDKVSGLDMGADDYITKPFAIEGLLARIRTVLHKRPAQAAEPPRGPLTAGPLTVDTDQHEVSVNGERVELARREFDLLHYLLENEEQVISWESLLDRVWGFDFVGKTNTVDVYIHLLRAKIDEHFGIRLIHTVCDVDYMIREEEQ